MILIKIDNVLSAEACKDLDSSIKLNIRPVRDKLVEKCHSAYALSETESLLLKLTDLVSSTVKKQLYPTYSYCRVYHKGASMRPHIDRWSCEISMSLCVGGEPWPLWFENYGPMLLQPGSAVIYPGTEITHWREEYPGSGCTQVFLHWVDANGPYANYKYDCRDSIAALPNACNVR